MLLLRGGVFLAGTRLIFSEYADSTVAECEVRGESDSELSELGFLQITSQLEIAARSSPNLLSASRLEGASSQVRARKGRIAGHGGGGSGKGSGKGGGRAGNTNANADVEAIEQSDVEALRKVSIQHGQDSATLAMEFFVVLAVAIPVLAALTALLCWCFMRKEDSCIEQTEAVPATKATYEPVEEDSYYCMVCSMVRDSQRMATGRFSLLRPARLVTGIAMVVLQMGIQLYLLQEIYRHVIAKVVPELQASYDEYEVHMYSNTYVTPGGFHRGRGKDFIPENFLTLPEEMRDVICDIPLAHDEFFIMVIFVWALSCTVDMRECQMMFTRLVVQTPTVTSMSDTTVTSMSEDKVLITGLTPYMKALIVIVIVVPRLVLDVLLLWMGCRWLAATADFAEVILNTVALEFIVLLKKLFFYSMVPYSNQMALKRTHALVVQNTLGPVQAFCAKFAWAFAAFGFCIGYVYSWQTVLPDYGWDVEDVCKAVAWY